MSTIIPAEKKASMYLENVICVKKLRIAICSTINLCTNTFHRVTLHFSVTTECLPWSEKKCVLINLLLQFNIFYILCSLILKNASGPIYFLRSTNA